MIGKLMWTLRCAAWSTWLAVLPFYVHEARAAPRAKRPAASAVVAEFSVGREGEPLIIPVTVRWRATSPAAARLKTVCRMWLDTGAGTTVFHNPHRAELGAPLAKIALKGLARSYDGEEFNAPTFEIGSESVRPNGSVLCVDMRPQIERLGEHIDGIIGMDVLGGLALSIDFDLGKLRFCRGGGHGAGTPVPIALDAWGRPKISAELPDGTRDWFLIDTGAVGLGAGNLGKEPYERLVDGGHLLQLSPRSFGRELRQDGISVGEARRATRFSVAGYAHENLVFLRIGANNLGLAYLSRYNVTFDFPNRAMYLRPSKRFADAERVALSGLELCRSDRAMRVAYVSADRPAAAAGIARGDVITEIDGEKTQTLTYLATERLLSTPGRHVLVVVRGAVEERVVLDLGGSNPTDADEARFTFDRRSRFPVVPVTVNGLARPFMLATCSTTTLFDTLLRESLGKPLGIVARQTLGGPAILGLFAAPRANVGPLPIGALEAVCCGDLSSSRYGTGMRLFGLLGTDFLQSWVVRIDFDRGEIAFLPEVPKGAGTRVDLHNSHGRPAAIASVPGAGPLPFVIDTAREDTGCLSGPPVAQLLAGGGATHVAMLQRMSAPETGQRKTESVRLVRVAAVEIGRFTQRDLIFGEEKENSLGLGFLSRYVVTFDFPGMTMYLKPGLRFNERDRHNLSGAALWCPSGRATVCLVEQHSAAEAAGLREGDVIDQVDGQDARRLALREVREGLSTAGTHRLRVTRRNETFDIVLFLR